MQRTLLFAADRNLMRMYVILAILALLLLLILLVVAFGVLHLKAAARSARKHESVAARLAAALAQADAERREAQAIAEVSEAVTDVLPAIRMDDQAPRRVA